ncbi:MAG: hypothetical protein ACI9FG_001278, partial [Crocinitomicaceae bacterium]
VDYVDWGDFSGGEFRAERGDGFCGKHFQKSS